MNFFDFFTDPVLRGPLYGSMLMCLSGALVGVLVFIRKASLLGETLSHATYPGVTFAIVCAALFSLESSLVWLILIGALFSSILGFYLIQFLQKKLKVKADASLTFVLAFFFGIGMVIASFAQFFYPKFFRQIQSYLYGQAATMTDIHILIYGALSLLILGIIALFYKEILASSFDRQFSKVTHLKSQLIDTLIIFLVGLAIVIGIKSCGVILMSAMLIAPAAAARQFTNSLSKMFLLSALFGVMSGLLGTYFSYAFSKELSFPTGPMIVLVASFFSFYALLLAPTRGLLIRYFRVLQFRSKTIEENLLKALWRISEGQEKKMTFDSILEHMGFSKIYLRFLLWKMRTQGWLGMDKAFFSLSPLGVKKGGQIVRLHRLWEVYLVHSLGLNVERVHKSAEEMEHILTPEIEKRLTELLDDPKQDPHDQPIPSHEEVMAEKAIGDTLSQEVRWHA